MVWSVCVEQEVWDRTELVWVLCGICGGGRGIGYHGDGHRVRWRQRAHDAGVAWQVGRRRRAYRAGQGLDAFGDG
jgi:hypothetical protein